MDHRLSPAAELARRVADESDQSSDPSVIDEARRRALAGFSAKKGGVKGGPSSAGRRRIAIVFAAAAALAAFFVFGFVMRLSRGPALTYRVGDEVDSHAIGAWIAAGDRAVPLRFSEGTLLTLAAEARARVTRADTDGADVLLERGSLDAKVVHRNEATRWTLRAGPFEINVVGTEVTVAWDPGRDEIDVRMIEGRVIVTGPLLDGGRALSAGQRLRVAVRDQRLDLTVAAPDATPTSAAAAGPPALSHSSTACPPDQCDSDPASDPTKASEPSKSADPPSKQAPSSTASPASSEAWRELAQSGKPKDAMEAAEREGFSSVLARSSPSDLLALADVARYAGDYGRARSALLMARQKGQRGRPTFLLGKIAADHLGASADAIRWFQTYLEEEPGGGLAEQALGRIIELKRRSGDAAGARSAAQKYLSRYPSGAYAALARLASGP